MAPRIVESSDEYDEQASQGSSSEGQAKKGSKAKKPAISSSKTATNAKPTRATSGRTSAVAINQVPAPVPVAPTASTSQRPAARKAAIKANESMDVDEAMASDQDEGDEVDAEAEDDEDGDDAEVAVDGEGEYEDTQDAEGDEDDEDDAEGDEEEDDYEDESQLASPSGTQSPTTSAADSAGPMKLKFKLGANQKNIPATSSPSQPPLPRNVVTLKGKAKNSGKALASSSKAKGKGKQPATTSKAKRKREDEFDEDANAEEDEEEGVGLEEEDEESFDEEDFLAANSEDSEIDVTKMTARQRAAHVGADMGFMTLPDAPSRKKIFTAEEVAMRKVETSRRRKHLLNKKLEEEKTETIDRLLKKQIGRKSGGGGSRLAAATKVSREDQNFTMAIPTGVDAEGNPIPTDATPVRLPTMFRWVSSIKDGVYKELWNVPLNLEGKFDWPNNKIEETNQLPPETRYPPPRPPPPTRMLKGNA